MTVEPTAVSSEDLDRDDLHRDLLETIDPADMSLEELRLLKAKRQAAGESIEGDWPRIRAHDVPPFPLDALPAELALYAENVAEHTQTPVDVAAVVMLGVLSVAALGLRVNVFWGTEELSLYILLTAISGDRKSSVMNIVTKPLEKIVEEQRRQELPDLLRAKDEIQELIKRRDALNKKLVHSDDPDQCIEMRERIHGISARLQELGEPESYRLLAQDVTPEALDRLFCRHGQQALISDEGGAIANALGQYNEGNPKLDGLCRAYTGGKHQIDRVNQPGPPLEAKRIIGTLVFTVQDHILEALVSNQAARTQGLVGRFAFSLPETRQGERLTRSTEIPPLSPDLAARWEAIVRKVYARKPVPKGPEAPIARRFGTFGTTSGTEEQKDLSLSRSATELLDRVLAEQEPKLGDGGELEGFRDWMARHASRIVRVAALLHLATDDAGAPIGDVTMAAAIRIGEYFQAHSAAALLDHNPILRKTKVWLSKRADAEVSRRELRRGPLRSRDKPAQITKYINELCDSGVLRDGLSPPTGGRPKELYDINPYLRAASAQGARSIG